MREPTADDAWYRAPVRALLQRDIEIDPHEDTLTADTKIAKGEFAHTGRLAGVEENGTLFLL